MRSVALFLLAAATSWSLAATAQEPPGRVGRVAYVEGNVSIYQDPDQGWEQAYVNAPITSENSLWTDPGARAEAHVAGIAIRLGEATQLDIARLDDDALDAFVVRGSAAVRVRHFDNNQRLDLATPHAAFRLYGTGRYRIDVDPERNETVLAVFAGTASMGQPSAQPQPQPQREQTNPLGRRPGVFPEQGQNPQQRPVQPLQTQQQQQQDRALQEANRQQQLQQLQQPRQERAAREAKQQQQRAADEKDKDKDSNDPGGRTRQQR